MTERHRLLATAVAADIMASGRTRSVLLDGSVARGTAIPDSDLDLLGVSHTKMGMERFWREGILVEVVTATPEHWSGGFEDKRPWWLYHFLEAQILVDDGAGAALIDEAKAMYDSFSSPEELLQDYAAALWHWKPKLERASISTPENAAFWASFVLNEAILPALYGLYNRPEPAGPRRLDLLWTIPLPEVERAAVSIALTGVPAARLKSVLSLVELLERRLPEPDLLKVEWRGNLEDEDAAE